METAIKSIIEKYVMYISQKNISGLNSLLNYHFRIIQVTGDQFSPLMLTKVEYLQMFVHNKAGGDEYTIENLSIQHVGPTATASYTLAGKQTNMHVFLQLVQTSESEWSIIGNMPVVATCPH